MRSEKTAGDLPEACLVGWVVGPGDEQIEGSMLSDAVHALDGEMLGIGKGQDLMGTGKEDPVGQVEQRRGDLSDGAGRGAGGETDGLSRVRVEGEERLSGLDGRVLRMRATLGHLALAVTANTMRIHGDRVALEMAEALSYTAEVAL